MNVFDFFTILSLIVGVVGLFNPFSKNEKK